MLFYCTQTQGAATRLAVFHVIIKTAIEHRKEEERGKTSFNLTVRNNQNYDNININLLFITTIAFQIRTFAFTNFKTETLFD